MSETEECDYKNIKDYKTAFDCFKQRFLVDKKSIFNLDCDNDVLTSGGIKYLEDNFINNGYTGNASFIDKIEHQLITKPLEAIEPDSVTLKNAIEILATAVWLWRLPPANTNKLGRINSVKDILDLDKSLKALELTDNPFFNEQVKGFATTGTYYNTNKPTELAYAIKFFKKCLNENDINSEILQSDELNGKMSITTTKDYSINKEGKKILGKKSDKSHDKERTVSIHNALLHFMDTEKFEPILSNDHKLKIKNVFSKIYNIEEENIDKAISNIKQKLLSLNGDYDNFYLSDIRNNWQGGLDFESKNIIIHGAPGTGKTYLTEQTINARKLIEENCSYELVQFHPSYSYEDFIEGIKPTEIIEASGQMKFELKNGIFKQMCIEAFKELIKENKEKSHKAKTFYFIADEINRAELSRVFGELLLCLEDDKRLRIDDGKVYGTKVQTPNSNLWKKEHAVVTVSEDDNLDENGHMYFGVPENIYFIGTMNDIDRSVDSFDMALRRRFVWKHYRFNDEPIEEKYNNQNIEKLEKYIKACNAINKYIVDINGFNLPTSYELGQSYFMKPKKLTQKELDRVWSENIAPLLHEYLRSQYSEEQITKMLKNAKTLYSLK